MKTSLQTRVLMLCLLPFTLLLAQSVALLRGRPGMAAGVLALAAVLGGGAALAAVVLCTRAAEARAADGLAAALEQNRTTAQQEILQTWMEGVAASRREPGVSDQAGHAASVEWAASLAAALDARDPYTEGHSLRVSQSACAVGRALGLTEQVMERLRVGAVLHDLGKIGVGDAILQKDGPLTDEEAALVQVHPRVGRKLLEGMHGFSDYLAAVEQHHENWDGTGYPLGLRGEETVVEARIIHVADAYDAMTRDRCYRQGMGHEAAIDILKTCAGTHFDPEVVSIFAALPVESLAVPGKQGERPASQKKS